MGHDARRVNWDALQGVRNAKTKEALPQGDVNVKAMSMGSWRANRSASGAKRPKGRHQ